MLHTYHLTVEKERNGQVYALQHLGSLLGQQPRAKTVRQSPKGNETNANQRWIRNGHLDANTL